MLKWFSVSHLGVKKYWRKSNVSSMLWREIGGSEVRPGGSASRVTILAFSRNHPYLFAISRSDIPVIYDIRIFSLINVGRIPMLRP
jgi:hypothetical protein